MPPGSAAGKFLHRRGFRGPAEPPGHAAPHRLFSVLLGFAANLAGGPDGPVARGLTAVTQVMMQLIRLLTYYAPAGLVADYGPRIAGASGHGAIFTAGLVGGGLLASCCGTARPAPDVSGDLLIGGHHPRQSGRRWHHPSGTWRRWSFLWGYCIGLSGATFLASDI